MFARPSEGQAKQHPRNRREGYPIDSPRTNSNFVEIVPPFHRLENSIISAAVKIG